MDEQTAIIFEAALRDLGVVDLRLDQVVMVYQRAFPANAMRSDMRKRLHEALSALVQSGIISVTEENDAQAEDPLSLPLAVKIAYATDGASFLKTENPPIRSVH